MVVGLRAGALVANEEGFARQVVPGHVVGLGQRMIGRQHREQGFVPDAARVAIRKIGSARDESDVELIVAELDDDVAGRPFGDLDRDAGMGLAVAAEQVVEKAAGGERIDADADAAEFALREGAGCLHGMFEVVDADGDILHEMPARLG